MEYCDGGDLHGVIAGQKGRLLPEADVLLWFSQVTLAVDYLHARKILHRDLKTQVVVVVVVAAAVVVVVVVVVVVAAVVVVTLLNSFRFV